MYVIFDDYYYHYCHWWYWWLYLLDWRDLEVDCDQRRGRRDYGVVVSLWYDLGNVFDCGMSMGVLLIRYLLVSLPSCCPSLPCCC